jgi:hypothetical protein
LRNIERGARSLALEIERLAPAVDRENSPANAEYPWTVGETVFVPEMYEYSVFKRLSEPAGANFLKLVEIAIRDYYKITLLG